MAAISNDVLIKFVKAKDIGGGLHAGAVDDFDWQGALLFLGYDPKEWDENRLKKTPVAKIIAEAPRGSVNRQFKIGSAKRWALQMGKGLWVQNGMFGVYDTNGQIVTTQHRLAALLLLTQWWLKGKIPAYMEKLAKARNAPTIPMGFTFGVSAKKHVADTADTGMSRTLNDVLFRSKIISGKSRKQSEINKLYRALGVAARLVWLRVGGKLVQNGPKFDQAEGLAFVQDKHPQLVKTLEWMDALEDNNKECITSLMPLGVAAGLMYLMSTSETVWDSGEISFTMDETAEKFWESFARADGHVKGSPVLALREWCVRNNKKEAKNRDALNHAVIKAWLAYINKEKDVSPSDLNTKKGETAHTGGLDLSPEDRKRLMEPVEGSGEPEPEAPKKPAKKAAAKKAPKKPAKGKPAKDKPESDPVDDVPVPADDDDDDVTLIQDDE